ncbi:MAG: aminotransferase class IV [Candidatus Bilamarchaeaceae archaeon]
MSDEFFIRGKKELKQKSIEVKIETTITSFLMDDDANYIYYSKTGGFVPPSQALDTILTNPIHYGAGLFEGMRYYYSPYGTVIVEPWQNIARMMHSATFFSPILATEIKKIFEKEQNVEEIRLDKITPRQYYALAEIAYKEGKNPSFPITIIRNMAGNKISEKRLIELNLKAVCGAKIKLYDMTEIDNIIKILAFANKLVSIDYFPERLEMVLSGYIRPFAWVSGEKGLKVPTILKTKDGLENKPMYFAVATLPWGVYLNEDDYARGLDVLIGPYKRLGKDMPSDAKIAGNYVNSALNINLGAMFGYGEILALNNGGRVVEGSAENLFVIYKTGNKISVYTPPTGSGCLPGTTRDRIIRTLESVGATITYRAPTLNELYNADGVLLTGTGAQMIHVRSVSELKAADKIAEMMHLQPENKKSKYLSIKKDDFSEKKKLINNGERHEIIDFIRKKYEEMLLKDPQALEPVYNINIEAICKALDLDKHDIASKEDIENERAGYFKERINGLKQPEELMERTKRAACIVKKAIEKSERKRLQRITATKK